MSVQALAGLAALNLLYLATGLVIMWAARGWETWLEVARLAGLAYLVGVVANGAVWTLWLIVGVPFSFGAVLGLPLALISASVLAVRRIGRHRPGWAGIAARPGLLANAAGIAAVGVLLEGLFRNARLSGLYWWDGWSFWIPKAMAIYFLGGLDEQFFTGLPGSSYPPLVPVLDAAAFHFMGSPDVVTLHVQYWLFGVGFVWAVAGLLAERVPPAMLWPFVLLILLAPRIGRRFHITEADLLLDFLFVTAAILVSFWLVERHWWTLGVATLLLGGVVLTKREGLLFAAALLVAALLASLPRWRSAWPPLAIAGVAVAAAAAPWRIWYVAHGVAGEAPSGGGLNPAENAERLWPSLRLALDVLFSSDYWSVLVPVAIAALVLAVLVGASASLAVYYGSLVALLTLGGGWITWAIPELPITQEFGGNPIVRYMGAAALVCAVASPLLLASTWSSVTSTPQGERDR